MDLERLSTDQLETELLRFERLRRQAAAVMVALVGEADRRQVPLADGCRDTAEWVSARLDVDRDEAKRLADLGVRLEGLPVVSERLAKGEVGIARAHAISRVATPDTEQAWMNRLSGYDLAGVERQVARHRRVTRRRERRNHDESFLSIQPSLDEGWWRIRGGVGGLAGRVISKTLRDKADQLPRDAGPLHHRQALALEQLCLGDEPAAPVSVTAFLDLDAAQGTGGEAGGEVEFGPRIGPDTLQELLCEGTVQIVGLQNGRPVVTSNRTTKIPPAVRDYVAWRDGACRAPGCTSRHRLQPHHIVPRSHGGSHDPDNLITLCWYHHHIVVHRRGYRIEQDQQGTIRFRTPTDSRDPPR